jgi:myo-inositol-1(or 4)-monophosphatase
VAAGGLLVEEAGGRVTDFQGGSFDVFGRDTLASNGKIHGEMIEVLNLRIPGAPPPKGSRS